jgi:hypothetical protein
MKLHLKFLLLGAAAATSVTAFSPGLGLDPRPVRRLGFHAMSGVDGPCLGTSNARNEMVGDRLPWTVSEVRGVIDSTGHLHARIRGLVLADSPAVPPDLRLRNDQQRFHLVLTCQTEDVDGRLMNTQVATKAFFATDDGDCEVDADFPLPDPCVGPVLYITGVDDTVWLARSEPCLLDEL